MKRLHNIEKRWAIAGYMGWNSVGSHYWIHRDGSKWVAVRGFEDTPGAQTISARTLTELSAKLAKPIEE